MRRPKNWWRTSASAISVPTIVEIAVARKASLRLVSSASVSSSRLKAWAQCSNVNPTQV